MTRHRAVVSYLVLAAGFCLGATAAAAPADEGGILKGRIDLRGRYAVAEGDSDQDIYSRAWVDYRDRARGRERYALYASGSLRGDIDGLSHHGIFDDFADTGDTWSDNLHGYLHAAYVDVKKLGPGKAATLRLGRQGVQRGLSLTFDGARADYAGLPDCEFRALAGQTVHFYESSPKGDLVAGAGALIRPRVLSAFRAGFDWYHIEDEKLGVVENEDEIGIATGLFSPHPALTLSGEYSFHPDMERKALGAVRLAPPGTGLTVTASAERQNQAIEDYVTDLSPYFHVVGRYAPFYQYRAQATQQLGEHLALEGGGLIRELKYEGDTAIYNREFSRFWASVFVIDLPVDDLTLRATGEMWDSDRDDAYTAGGSITKGFGPLQLEGGTGFSLFKYDRYTGLTRDEVTSWYGRADYEVKKGMRIFGSYELEEDDTDIYHTMETGVRYAF